MFLLVLFTNGTAVPLPTRGPWECPTPFGAAERAICEATAEAL